MSFFSLSQKIYFVKLTKLKQKELLQILQKLKDIKVLILKGTTTALKPDRFSKTIHRSIECPPPAQSNGANPNCEF